MATHSPNGELLLDVASRLFYSQGIGAVGVDRVAEEAGVSKPTLYAQFGSKAGLIAAVLDRRREERRRAVEEYMATSGAEADSRVLALFDWFASGHAKPGFRGCPFTNAAVEIPDSSHPAYAVILSYKEWVRQTLAGLAAEDGLPDPGWWGSALALLIDGANARVVISGDTTAILDAKTVAATLIKAARGLPPTPGEEKR